jgi:hypothetical protein
VQLVIDALVMAIWGPGVLQPGFETSGWAYSGSQL